MRSGDLAPFGQGGGLVEVDVWHFGVAPKDALHVASAIEAVRVS